MSKVDELLKKADFFEKLSSDDDVSELMFTKKFAQQATDPFYSDKQKVLRLQSLLNIYLKSKGRNEMLLIPDGVIGPKTEQAINFVKKMEGKSFTPEQLLTYLGDPNSRHMPDSLRLRTPVESVLGPEGFEKAPTHYGVPLAKKQDKLDYTIPLPFPLGERPNT